MRTVTVDMRGLWFTLKLALVVTVMGGAWSLWGPFADEVQSAEESSVVLASTLESGVEGTQDTPSHMLPETGRFVLVDTNVMRIVLRDGTEEVASFPILHLPAEDSPDALRVGTYFIDTVSDMERSSITMVLFPSYVSFGNRFAFHGTPRDVDDQPLSFEYAGASVWLPDDDAAKLVLFATQGMQVYVNAPATTHDRRTGDVALSDIEDGALPATSASAFTVQDMESGQVYLAKRAHDRYPIASITKLVTAAVASEIIGHGTELRAPNGERYMLGDLFYPLLLRSDNAVAERIAAYLPPGEFIAHMNTYVRAYSMERTSFADSSGLSPRNLSSAHDLAVLAKHLYDKKEYLLAMAGEDEVIITSTEGNERRIVNQNKFADDPYFRGGKLGYTDEAMQTSLAIFNVPVGSETRPVAVIILGSQDWKQDTRTLLQWLTANRDE